jgi:hypothetical protein
MPPGRPRHERTLANLPIDLGFEPNEVPCHRDNRRTFYQKLVDVVRAGVGYRTSIGYFGQGYRQCATPAVACNRNCLINAVIRD